MLWFAIRHPLLVLWTIRTQLRYQLLGSSDLSDVPDWYIKEIANKPEEVYLSPDEARWFQNFTLEARRRGLK